MNKLPYLLAQHITLPPSGGGSGGGGSYTIPGSSGIVNPVISQSIGNFPNNPAMSADKLANFIAIFLRLAITFGAVFCLIYLVWGAFEWIVSGGDKGNIENARNKMTHAVIGLALIAISLVLITFIGTFLQINLLNLTIPTI